MKKPAHSTLTIAIYESQRESALYILSKLNRKSKKDDFELAAFSFERNYNYYLWYDKLNHIMIKRLYARTMVQKEALIAEAVAYIESLPTEIV